MASSSPQSALQLLDLPEEALLQVLGSLPLKELVKLQGACRELRTLTTSNSLWQQVATSKWGALAAEQTVVASWYHYCRKRISHGTIAQSPLHLVQERFGDPWEHIVCCLCCCRTSGSQVISNAIDELLCRYSTPTALLQADPAEVKQSLCPLGLQDTRYTSLRRTSEAFLHTTWSDPCEFYGCGKFISDSWRIFCCGDLSPRNIEDANLRAYLRWANGAEARPSGGSKAQKARPQNGNKRKGEVATLEAKTPGGGRHAVGSKFRACNAPSGLYTPEQTAPSCRVTRRQLAAADAEAKAHGRVTRARASQAPAPVCPTRF